MSKKIFEENILTDLTLILVDNTTKLSLNVHKLILSASDSYFQTMLLIEGAQIKTLSYFINNEMR